jgi:GntR family transcriptional regulator / MocR family aminotransferase
VVTTFAGRATSQVAVATRERHVRDVLLSVERSRGIPLGRQIEDGLRQAIRRGLLAAGTRLPSTRALAEDLAVSRGVVVRAYEQLAGEGYIDLRQGATASVRSVLGDGRLATRSPATGQTPRLRYDLRPHVPEVGLFPRRAWLRSQRHALTTATDADIGYIDSGGLERLRLEIAAYVGRARGVAARPEQVVVTAGTTHSVSLICRALARRGTDAVGFENPSHHLLHAVASSAGLEPVGIAVDREGLVVGAIPDRRIGAVVVAPAHQFPSGCSLSPSRRTALVQWAIENDALVVEDEYDAEFRYDRAPIDALHGLAPGHVAYLGSTGKTLAPAVRLGWAILPEGLCADVQRELATSVVHISGLDQLTFVDFLARGELDRHLRRMRSVYMRRRDILVEALSRRLPNMNVSGIAAGLHVVLELPSFELEERALEAARGRGIYLQSLSEHALPGYDGPAGLLIGFGGITEAAVPAAVEELAAVVAL